MAVKGARASKFAEFLKSPRARGQRCETCKMSKDILDTIKQFAEAVDKGLTEQSAMAFHRFLSDEFSYPLGETALNHHIASCVRGQTTKRAKRRG